MAIINTDFEKRLNDLRELLGDDLPSKPTIEFISEPLDLLEKVDVHLTYHTKAPTDKYDAKLERSTKRDSRTAEHCRVDGGGFVRYY